MIDLFPDGTGIFETIRTRSGRPFLLERHLMRATESAKILGLSLPSLEAIMSQILGCINENPVHTEFGRLRVTFPGMGEIGVVHLPYEMWERRAKLTLDSIALDQGAPSAGIKALPYRENLEILQRARDAGFDDAIRLNLRGEVCETAIANLLLRVNGVWTTPPRSTGALPGIMRSLALQLLAVEERTITGSDLDSVDSLFLVSSLRGFQPVESLEGRPLHIDYGMVQKAASLARNLSVE